MCVSALVAVSEKRCNRSSVPGHSDRRRCAQTCCRWPHSSHSISSSVAWSTAMERHDTRACMAGC